MEPDAYEISVRVVYENNTKKKSILITQKKVWRRKQDRKIRRMVILGYKNNVIRQYKVDTEKCTHTY